MDPVTYICIYIYMSLCAKGLRSKCIVTDGDDDDVSPVGPRRRFGETEFMHLKVHT